MKPIIDISSYQSPAKLNYQKIASQVSGVILRVAYGSRPDTKFEEHYAKFSALGVPIGAYHYICEYVSADAQVNALAQMQGKRLDLGFWVDVEVEPNAEKLTSAMVLHYIGLLNSRGIDWEGIYTSQWMWKQIFGQSNPITNKKWWVADYTWYSRNVRKSPLLPYGVNNAWLWQYTSSGRLDGYGDVLDVNDFMGTVAQYQEWIHRDGEPVAPDPMDPLYRAKVTATIGLKIRSGAGLNYPQVGSLSFGQEVSIYEERNGWLRVDPHRQWWSSGEWLERIPDGDVYLPTIYFGALYGQRDPRWIREPLGTKSTIGAHGCLMTCAAIVAESNPHELNRWLTANGGYQDGNLFLWAKLEEFEPTLRFEGFTYNPTDNDIKAKLTAGIMPILLVDFDERTPMQEMHWVVAIGIDTEGYVIIHDPWTDDIIRLRDRYKKPLLRFGSYLRTK